MMIKGNGKSVTEFESIRRYELTMMHLVDRNAEIERTFCGADASDDERVGVDYYLEMRKDGFGVGAVCEGCKVPAPQFAMELAQDLETEGLVDEAENYHRLAQTLLEETGQNGPNH